MTSTREQHFASLSDDDLTLAAIGAWYDYKSAGRSRNYAHLQAVYSECIAEVQKRGLLQRVKDELQRRNESVEPLTKPTESSHG